MKLYDRTLADKPWIVVANKMDLPEAEEKLKHFRTRYKKLEIFPIGSDSDKGIKPLIKRLGELVLHPA